MTAPSSSSTPRTARSDRRSTRSRSRTARTPTPGSSPTPRATSTGRPPRRRVTTGTVFKLDAVERLGADDPPRVSGPDGYHPSGLIADASGNLYGTTQSGGPDAAGTVFELDAANGYALITLHGFTGIFADGAAPSAPLVADLAGNLYGTTAAGFESPGGTVLQARRIERVRVDDAPELHGRQHSRHRRVPSGGAHHRRLWHPVRHHDARRRRRGRRRLFRDDGRAGARERDHANVRPLGRRNRRDRHGNRICRAADLEDRRGPRRRRDRRGLDRDHRRDAAASARPAQRRRGHERRRRPVRSVRSPGSVLLGLPRRAAGGPLPRRGRKDLPQWHHGRLRRRLLLPGQPGHPGPDGRFSAEGKARVLYVPPSCTGLFVDVACAPVPTFAADWIEQLAREGITAGCGGGNYCPGGSVTRAQMAVLLLKAEHGSSYTPPACAGVFPDVACTPTPAFAADWIEQLSNEGITAGCGGGNYCPANPVSRGRDGGAPHQDLRAAVRDMNPCPFLCP